MPLTGGASAKYGDRFEGKWTVYCLAQVLAETALGIRLEPPGPEGEGCEFRLKRLDGVTEITEYHQVKRQHATPRSWTMGDLNGEGVLNTAYEKTKDIDSRFVFVSTQSASALAELIDSAVSAESLEEFESFFISGKLKKNGWTLLLKAWRSSVCEDLGLDPTDGASQRHVAHTAYERLQRIDLRVVDEALLGELVDSRLGLVVSGVPSETLRSELAAYAFEHVHASVDTATLLEWVASKSYGLVNYAKDERVCAAIRAQNARHAGMIDPISGHITLARKEAQSAFEILAGEEEKQSVLVSGAAGIGKSGIIAQTIDLLHDEGIPYLYFRVDRLNPSPIPKHVGEQLGLPESPSATLANYARFKRSVLVVDQLDDVSLVSGRNPDFFDCIDEIIQEATRLPGVRLLMACREFDLQKDNRLGKLVGKNGPAVEVSASLLDLDEVLSVLSRLDQKTNPQDSELTELLRLPLHLSMYADVLASTPQGIPVVRSKIDLFDKFWETKLRQVNRRLEGNPCPWTEVVDRLCERITADGSLFVDRIALDDFTACCYAMLTERVLVLEGDRIGFFHGAFFDYAFARRFVSKNNDLLVYVLDGEQALFKRPVLRQIVLYWVEKAATEFADAIRRLLFGAEVRFHLKQCVLDAIAQAGTTSTQLWAVLEEAIEGEDKPMARAAERLLVESSTWFSFLYERGILSTWLAAEDSATNNRSRWCVNQQIEVFPDACADLLLPYIGKSDECDAWILRITGSHAQGKSRGLFDIFLSLVNRGVIPTGATPDFWTYTYSLHEKQPAWAAEAISSYLARCFETMTADEFKEQILKKSVHSDEVIPKISAGAPYEFLDGVLPIFLKIIKQNERRLDPKRLRTDSVWLFRHLGSPMYVSDALLEGLEGALRQVAEDDPVAFQRYFEWLAPYGDHDSVNFLLLRAVAVLDETCADQAVEYMLEIPQRLESGWQMGGTPYWAAREAVSHSSGLCSDGLFQQLEKAMMDYYPAWERSKDGHREHGYWQLIMLPALESSRRNQATDARILELQRKFPDAAIAAPNPTPTLLGAIGSPIPESATKKMSNANWLQAISKYDQDRDYSGKDHRLWGGAVELSRQLESAVEENPDRFAELAHDFTQDTNPYYFDSVLMGLRKADAAKETVFDVVRHFFSLAGKPGARWMSGAIIKYSAEEIPEDILGIVGWLATEATDPKTDVEAEEWSKDSPEEERPGNYVNRAINTVRGSAAEDIGYLIHADADRVEFFSPYLRSMVHDPTVTVRSTAAHALRGLFAHDEDLAIELFLKLCQTQNDVLLATSHVDMFLYHGNILHFDQLQSVIQRMLESTSDVVREAGARHVCLAQFSIPAAIELAAACVAGDEAQRKGAASVAQANVFTAKCRQFSEAALVSFFNDPSEEVRDSAARCFIRAKGQDLEDAQGLIQSFLGSRSFPEQGEFLVMGLKNSTADLSAVIIEVCEAVLSALEDPLAEPFGRLFFEAQDLASLVFRAYSQSNNPDYRSRCLDMIDGFVAAQAYGVAKQLIEYER